MRAAKARGQDRAGQVFQTSIRSGKARGSVPALCWVNDMHHILKNPLKKGSMKVNLSCAQI